MKNSVRFKQTLYIILDKENLLIYDKDKILKINIKEIEIDEISYFKKHILKLSYNNKIYYEFEFSNYRNNRQKKLSIEYCTNNDNIVDVVNKIMNKKSIIPFMYYIANAKIDNLNVIISEDNDNIIEINGITLRAPRIKTSYDISYFASSTYIRYLCINTYSDKIHNKLGEISKKIIDKISNLNIHSPIFTIDFDYIVFESRIFFVLNNYIREIKDELDIQEIILMFMKKMFNLKINDEEHTSLLKLMMQ